MWQQVSQELVLIACELLGLRPGLPFSLHKQVTNLHPFSHYSNFGHESMLEMGISHKNICFLFLNPY